MINNQYSYDIYSNQSISYRKNLLQHTSKSFLWLFVPGFSITLALLLATQSLLMGLAFVSFGGIIILFSPTYTVPVLFLGSLVDYISLYWGSPFRVFMFLALGVFFAHALSSQESFSVKLKTAVYAVTFFLFVFCIPNVFSEFPMESLKSSRYLLNGILSAIAAYFFASKCGLPKTKQWYFLLINISVIFLITAYKGQDAIACSARLTLSETINPNQLAINLTYSISILLGFLLISEYKLQKIVFFFVFCVGLYDLILTGSRTNFIATMVIFVLFLGYIMLRNRRLHIKTVLLVIFLVTTVLFLQYFTFHQNILFLERYSLESVVETKGSSRFEAWENYGRALFNKPKSLIIGSGSSPEATLELLSQEGIPSIMRILPHNMYIQSVIFWGIPGALIFFLLLLKTVISGVKTISKNQNVLPFLFCVIAVFFIGLGETGLGDKTLWLSVGTIFAEVYRDPVGAHKQNTIQR